MCDWAVPCLSWLCAAQQCSAFIPVTFHTSDLQYNRSCHLQKCSDDSAVVGCISDEQEEEYRAEVDDFVAWPGRNHLLVNVNKTEEMVVSYRRKRTATRPFSAPKHDANFVDYKDLSIHIDNKPKQRLCT